MNKVNWRTILIYVLIAVVGYAIGFGIVKLYKAQQPLEPVQELPAPGLGV